MKTYTRQMIPVINQAAPNEILDRGEFHISFNPSVSDYGSKTTAIVLRNTVFLTLNGDHRDKLREISEADGLRGCFDYFLENIGSANFMCNHHQIVRGDNTFNIARDAERILGAANIDRLRHAVDARANADTELPDPEIDTDPGL